MWTDVVGLLEREGDRGDRRRPVDDRRGQRRADFYADARAVRELLDQLEGPVLLCGHSYGGAVITEAAAGPHPAVGELVYLTAALPCAGDSMVSLMSAAAAQAPDAEEEGVTIQAVDARGRRALAQRLVRQR